MLKRKLSHKIDHVKMITFFNQYWLFHGIRRLSAAVESARIKLAEFAEVAGTGATEVVSKASAGVEDFASSVSSKYFHHHPVFFIGYQVINPYVDWFPRNFTNLFIHRCGRLSNQPRQRRALSTVMKVEDNGNIPTEDETKIYEGEETMWY